MNEKNRMDHYEAEEESGKIRGKVENNEAQSYGKAEKLLEKEEKIKQLEKALFYINRPAIDFRNTNFYLRKAAMYSQVNELLEVSFKRKIDWAFECIKNKQPPYFQSGLFFDNFVHTFYDGYESNLGTNYYKAVGKYAAKVNESRRDYQSLRNAAEIYASYGDKEQEHRMCEMAETAKKNRENSVGSGNIDWEFIRQPTEEFINEVKDDPILQIDDNAVIEKVRKEIEQKLAELKSE